MMLLQRKRNAEHNRLQKSLDVFPWGYPEWINYYGQANQLPLIKTAFQKEVHSQVLQDTLKRVERSFQNFFNGAGYPRFQGRNRYNSFTYPGSGLKLKGGKLILSKIGAIKIILHREIEGKIKTCTIKRDVDQWYVSFSCQIDIPIIPIEIKTITGIHRRIRYQRKDFNQKLSTNLVNNYDHVVFEKLQIQNMLKNHCLAKSIVDASWSQLINFLNSR